mgnify:CR=1
MVKKKFGLNIAANDNNNPIEKISKICKFCFFSK